MIYIKNMLWILLLIVSACDTKLPDGVKVCSDDINIDCYMKVANKKDCFIYLDIYSGETEIKWSGACEGHFTEGNGVLTTYSDNSGENGVRMTGRMKNGDFIGRREGYSFSNKDNIIHLIETDTTLDVSSEKNAKPMIKWHYKKSDECQVDYIKCWKGFFSRSENNDELLLVGYMYIPKPYKREMIKYGILYGRNICAEVEWRQGRPYPKKKVVPPLIDAVIKVQYERVKSLLADKHPPNFADGNGRTPLMFAVSKKGMGSELITKLLLKYGANIKKKDKDGKTVYDHVTKQGYSGNFIKMLNDARDGTNSFFNSIEEFNKAKGDLSRLPELRKKQKEEDDKKNDGKKEKKK